MIATIAYAVIAAFQLAALNRETEIMQGTLAEMKRSGEQSTEQMWSAVGNINWMARSMDLSQQQTQKSLQATVDNFHSDQRAWVGQIDSSVSEVKEGAPITFRVTIGNSGKTPALKVRTKISSAHGPKTTKFVPQYSEPNTSALQALGVLQPGGKGTMEQTTAPLTDISKFRSGAYLYYVFGRVDYEDVFGHPHWSTWCLYVGGEHSDNLRTTLQCDSYNNTDDANQR
jgi:hypothetical protein